MVTEPTYVYIRGQGWVPQNSDADFTHYYEGKCIKAYLRQPKPGEHYYYHSPRYAPECMVDGVFSLPAFVKRFGERDIDSKIHPGVVYTDHHNLPPGVNIVVFEVTDV